MTSPYAGCRNIADVIDVLTGAASGERSPEGASPATVPSANAASAASLFTLGPWVKKPILGEPGHFSIESADIRNGDYVAEVYSDADANLFVAARDLFDALKYVREAITTGGVFEAHTLQKIDAAIRKAEG